MGNKVFKEKASSGLFRGCISGFALSLVFVLISSILKTGLIGLIAAAKRE